MASRFDAFVICAGMRTGSNLLESALNSVPGVTCHGEAFNGAFLGWPGRQALLGVDRAGREADPGTLLSRIRTAGGMNGFRYFDDHDPRVLPLVAEDPRWAKIVLTRNPVDSYLSLKIARQTGQWKLGDLRGRRGARVPFDAAEFESHLAGQQQFRQDLMRVLQVSGQTAFWIDYDDLQDPAILTGLLRFLGVDGAIEASPGGLVPQNPGGAEEKVSNPAAMAAGLARMDRFNLSRLPNFEPRRGPAVPGFVTAAGIDLVYQPVRSGPEAEVRGWLARFGDPIEGMTQKEFRQWLRAHPGHRLFTVLRHPLARAHAAFRDTILSGRFAEIRDTLIHHYAVPIRDGMTEADHRAAFLGFLRWLKGNLSGQTGVRVDPAWASQSAVLAGLAQLTGPDHVLREERLAEGLDFLARETGLAPSAPPVVAPDDLLAAIHDRSLDEAAREAYGRDYAQFGFADWRPAR